ncbi:MAG: hypothetical protein HC880_12670 [Bacteroidia bacterium]|nr:hypothetical protein [Bacteroidia bacterium]
MPENYSYLISARQLVVREKLNPEIAWNYGASLNQETSFGGAQGKPRGRFLPD